MIKVTIAPLGTGRRPKHRDMQCLVVSKVNHHQVFPFLFTYQKMESISFPLESELALWFSLTNRIWQVWQWISGLTLKRHLLLSLYRKPAAMMWKSLGQKLKDETACEDGRATWKSPGAPATWVKPPCIYQTSSATSQMPLRKWLQPLLHGAELPSTWGWILDSLIWPQILT